MPPVAKLTVLEPDALLGSWNFTRTIEDAHGGVDYTASGRATLVRAGDAIRWHEDGLLDRDGGRYPVTRTLRIVPSHGDDTAPHWGVEFEDGRPFHEWMPATPLVHLCGSDIYRGFITVTGPLQWSITWKVTGPAKSYSLATRYLRSTDSASPTR